MDLFVEMEGPAMRRSIPWARELALTAAWMRGVIAVVVG